MHADELASIKKAVLPIRLRAQNCIAEVEEALQKRRNDLELLGLKLPKEEPDVARTRADLTRARDALEKRLAACRTVSIQAKDIKESSDAIEQATLARRLRVHGPSLRALAQDSLDRAKVLPAMEQSFRAARSGLQGLTALDGLMMLGALLLGFFGGRAVGDHLVKGARQICVDKCTGFLLALRTCGARSMPMIGAVGGFAAYSSAVLSREPVPFVTQAAWGFLAYLVLIGLVDTAFHPAPPAKPYLPLETDLAVTLAKRLKVLLGAGLTGFLLFGTAFGEALPESQYLMIRAVYGALLFVNLSWVLWLAGRFPGMAGTRGVRLLLVAALLCILSAEWLGYRNFSNFALIGLSGTLAGFGVVWFVGILMTDLFDGLDGGHQPWQKRFRLHLGLKNEERVPGLIWLRLTFGAVLWGGFGLWILWVWGLSERGIEAVLSLLHEGFELGGFHVVPLQIVPAVLAFSVLFSATGWFKRSVVPGWLKNTHLDRGARDALTTVTGYAGLTISALVALSMAGVEFANLAIIAGALSVGIGFGLQNIVNNFLSGLILLIERPIRTGDWIVVGATEGYVRKISIRSTQIQTFDRADVIVPNSELISSQVKNWMLHDSWGRIVIPVGVAYGSDTERVREILLAVAHDNEMVIGEGHRVLPPQVLISGFGESSLNFELRCFIRRIDDRRQVFSDLCFAIDKAFRAQGVEIPFPQRDLRVRNWPGRESPEATQGTPALGPVRPSGSGDQGDATGPSRQTFSISTSTPPLG